MILSRFACAALAAALLSGCGESTGQPSGKITLNGQPVGGADVKFASLANPEDEFVGLSRPDGTYSVSYREYDGLPVGKYAVTVTRYALPNGQPLPAGEQGDVLKNDGRTKTASYKFEREIVGGENALDLELSQGAK